MSAPYRNVLYVITIRTQKSVYGGPKYGTTYSMKNACPQCGTGAVQEGPLKLPDLELAPKQVALTLDFEILFGEVLAEELMDQGFDCFVHARHHRTQVKLPSYQLLSQKLLPPFSPRTSGYETERQCQACKRDGYFNIPHVPLRLHYSQLDRHYLEHDVLATWEAFGNSRLREPYSESHIASPVLVVTQKLHEALQGLKGVEFTEVEVDWS